MIGGFDYCQITISQANEPAKFVADIIGKAADIFASVGFYNHPVFFAGEGNRKAGV